MGVGHLNRCLALADTLRSRSIHSKFICREHEGHLLPLVGSAGMNVVGLPVPLSKGVNGIEEYAAWLGVSQEEDAWESMAALAGERPDWVVVDHYGLDARWERALRPQAEHLMVIDDLANRVHECDLLLDQNFFPAPDERYARLVPPECRPLLGPRFALLDAAYRRYRCIERRRDGGVGTIFVFFGGSDPRNLTGAALEALSCRSLRHLTVDVVVGANNNHRSHLQRLASDRPGTTLHGSRPHLADLMSRADLAIGAAGVTTWERMCLGVPSIVVSIAENQRPTAEALAENGLIRYLGAARNVGSADLSAAIKEAIDGKQELADQSLRGRLIVDGLGAVRVMECIDCTEPQRLCLRAAQIEDMELFFDWANDPEVRRQSLKTDAIAWLTHQQWFRTRLEDERSRMFVMEAQSLPVGQIRFDLDDGEALIDFSIEAQFRGRGWGGCLIAMGMARMTEREQPIFRAEVKASNPASAAVFARLGFRESASANRSDVKIYRFDSARRTLPEGD